MEYITPASTGNVTDFGDMLVGSAGNGHQMSNGIQRSHFRAGVTW